MPFYQALVLVILFAWLRMAEVCRSPFDGDSVYDVINPPADLSGSSEAGTSQGSADAAAGNMHR